MLVTRKCILTLKSNTLDLDITQSELDRINNRRSTGEYIQDIVPINSYPSEINQMSKNLPDDWGSHYRTCSRCGHRFHPSSGACFKCLEGKINLNFAQYE